MWTINFLPDPLHDIAASTNNTLGDNLRDCLARVRVPIEALFKDPGHHTALKEEPAVARIALADYVSRIISENRNSFQFEDNVHVIIRPLDRVTVHARRHCQRRRKARFAPYPPYILQRTAIWCNQTELNIIVHVAVFRKSELNDRKKGDPMVGVTEDFDEQVMEDALCKFLSRLFHVELLSSFADLALRHIACAILQERIRSELVTQKVVSFVANGAILPRRSGASSLPMSISLAIPFQAPLGSSMSRTITVDMGNLRRFLSNVDTVPGESTKVELSGLCVPAGVTLIVGGGYHGKSTLLRTIAAGVYNKIPGDGREFCATVHDAVSVRAEDGRYVNNCNVSAFISNLPTPPGLQVSLDTCHFSSREASGSTSQAANVSEAIEMGATALLVDEDVSAANFMARDGRMRALVADESITPLLYRVNGLYSSHGISSVVVVGGVGDWLDVPDNVILLDKCIASDATKKAQSVSYQFSYGHVQYAGRGVVHRLSWDKKGTPLQRRPSTAFAQQYNNDVVVSMLEGGHAMALHGEESDESSVNSSDSDEDCHAHDEHLGYIDMSRCEQLLGKKSQLYGCGLAVAWVLRSAQKETTIGIKDLLLKFEEALNEEKGILELFPNWNMPNVDSVFVSNAWIHLLESTGFAFIPRKHELAMALTRMRGIVLEELPTVDDGSEAEAVRDEERKRQALADLWNSRRKNKNSS